MKTYINNILFLLGIIVSGYILFNSTHKGYTNYYLVPLIFAIYVKLDKEIYIRAMNNVGFAMFFISSCFRFYIVPFITCASKYAVILGMSPTIQDYKEAVNLAIYEEITILFIFYTILRKKFYKTEYYLSNQVQKIELIKSHKLFTFIIVTSLLIILLIPQSISNINFITNLGNINLAETIVLNFPLAGLCTAIINLGRFFTILLLINYFYKKSKQGHTLFYIIISICIILLNASFVTNLSRFGMIVPIISFTYLLLKIYDNYKTKIIKIMILCTTIIIVGMSAIKFFSEDRNTNANASNEVTFWGETLQTYFMGIKEIAVGIHAKDRIDGIYENNKIALFFNDSFQNILGLSNLTTPQLNTTRLYNYTYFPNSRSISQIPPNIINGLYYFGWFLAPLYILLFIYMFSYLDYKVHRNSNIVLKFAFLYGALYCGLCMMINGAMLISFLINEMLAIIICFKLNKTYTNRK